jgi:hypothetical protein
MRARIFAALGVACAVSCIDPAARRCAGDSECHLEGVDGRCLAGACAYEDVACVSGQRYGPFATTDRAGSCAELDELCESESPGCDVSTEPGIEIGLSIWDAPASDEHGLGLARMEKGTWIVAGARVVDDESVPLVIALEESGTVAWRDTSWDDGHVVGSARGVASGSGLVVAGDLSGPGGTRAFTRAYAFDGAIRWTEVNDSMGDAAAHDVAVLGGGAVVVTVGRLSAQPWIEGRSGAGTPAWSWVPEPASALELSALTELDDVVLVAGRAIDAAGGRVWMRAYSDVGVPVGAPIEGPTIEVVHDVASCPGGHLAVAGSLGGEARVAKLGSDGASIWERRPFAGVAYAVAITPECDVVAAGDRAEGGAWITRWSGAGLAVWTTVLEGDAGEHEARDIRIDDTGDVIVLGSSLTERGDRDLWIRRFAPAGR